MVGISSAENSPLCLLVSAAAFERNAGIQRGDAHYAGSPPCRRIEVDCSSIRTAAAGLGPDDGFTSYKAQVGNRLRMRGTTFAFDYID